MQIFGALLIKILGREFMSAIARQISLSQKRKAIRKMVRDLVEDSLEEFARRHGISAEALKTDRKVYERILEEEIRTRMDPALR